MSRSGSGLRKEGPRLAYRQVLIRETMQEERTFSVCRRMGVANEKVTVITVCWALSVDLICSVHCSLLTQKIHGYFNQKEKFKKKNSLLDTLPSSSLRGKISATWSRQLTGPRKQQTTKPKQNKLIFIKIVYSTNLHKFKYLSLEIHLGPDQGPCPGRLTAQPSSSGQPSRLAVSQTQTFLQESSGQDKRQVLSTYQLLSTRFVPKARGEEMGK